MSERLCVPGLPPDATCEQCGHRNDAHHYRHRFISSAQRIDPWQRIAALEAKLSAIIGDVSEVVDELTGMGTVPGSPAYLATLSLRIALDAARGVMDD